MIFRHFSSRRLNQGKPNVDWSLTIKSSTSLGPCFWIWQSIGAYYNPPLFVYTNVRKIYYNGSPFGEKFLYIVIYFWVFFSLRGCTHRWYGNTAISRGIKSNATFDINNNNSKRGFLLRREFEGNWCFGYTFWTQIQITAHFYAILISPRAIKCTTPKSLPILERFQTPFLKMLNPVLHFSSFFVVSFGDFLPHGLKRGLILFFWRFKIGGKIGYKTLLTPRCSPCRMTMGGGGFVHWKKSPVSRVTPGLSYWAYKAHRNRKLPLLREFDYELNCRICAYFYDTSRYANSDTKCRTVAINSWSYSSRNEANNGAYCTSNNRALRLLPCCAGFFYFAKKRENTQLDDNFTPTFYEPTGAYVWIGLSFIGIRVMGIYLAALWRIEYSRCVPHAREEIYGLKMLSFSRYFFSVCGFPAFLTTGRHDCIDKGKSWRI